MPRLLVRYTFVCLWKHLQKGLSQETDSPPTRGGGVPQARDQNKTEKGKRQMDEYHNPHLLCLPMHPHVSAGQLASLSSQLYRPPIDKQLLPQWSTSSNSDPNPLSLKWLLVGYSVIELSTVTIRPPDHNDRVREKHCSGRTPGGVPEEWHVIWVSKKISYLPSNPFQQNCNKGCGETMRLPHCY